MSEPLRGNCYYATEALWHITGGKAGPWHIYRMPVLDGETHWFLRLKRDYHVVLDPSVRQFKGATPDYSLAKRAGFLTREPSRRGREMMERLTYQAPIE